MKKLFVVFMVLFLLVGCSSSDEQKKEDTPKEEVKEPSFGSVVEFDGLEITLSDNYEIIVLDNEFSDKNKSEVIKVPIHVKNTSDDVNGLNMFSVTMYGSKGVALDSVYTYFMDDDVFFVASTDSLRKGAETDAYMHILYDGDGDYFIAFDNFSTKIEVKLPIKK